MCKSVELSRSLTSHRKPHKSNIMAEGSQDSPWEAVQALEAISKSLAGASSSLQVRHQADTELEKQLMSPRTLELAAVSS